MFYKLKNEGPLQNMKKHKGIFGKEKLRDGQKKKGTS